jgi:transposase
MSNVNAYVGLDVHKETVAAAIAESPRDSEVRFFGNLANDPEEIRRFVTKMAARHGTVEFVYEAGPCGYSIHRQITAMGHRCVVVAPSRIPRRPNDRVKNDHRDAKTLARLARAGELTGIWVPDGVHEAMRDLVRARHAAARDMKVSRLRIQSFLLKHSVEYEGKSWTKKHRLWLASRRFEHRAQQIAFQSLINAMEQATARRTELETQIAEILPEWSAAKVVTALQALRGVGLVIAATVVSEVGSMSRFSDPRQLMAFLGLTPGEHSSGGKIRGRGITKAGNAAVRTLLFEAAWSYRQPAKVGAYMLSHMPEDIPQRVKDIAWKAQLRLTGRYRKLIVKGKKPQIAITAVARELVGFMWCIAGSVEHEHESLGAPAVT